jgi:hypothetical protein
VKSNGRYGCSLLKEALFLFSSNANRPRYFFVSCIQSKLCQNEPWAVFRNDDLLFKIRCDSSLMNSFQINLGVTVTVPAHVISDLILCDVSLRL